MIHLLKKTFILFLFSLNFVSCSTATTITKKLYTDGRFRYRDSETELSEGNAVESGTFLTNVNGEYTLTFILNRMEYIIEGTYFIAAKDDKNGEVTLVSENSEILETLESVTYKNYYFMYFIFSDIGKICFAR